VKIFGSENSLSPLEGVAGMGIGRENMLWKFASTTYLLAYEDGTGRVLRNADI
jgi:hypothetical protein